MQWHEIEIPRQGIMHLTLISRADYSKLAKNILAVKLLFLYQLDWCSGTVNCTTGWDFDRSRWKVTDLKDTLPHHMRAEVADFISTLDKDIKTGDGWKFSCSADRILSFEHNFGTDTEPQTRFYLHLGNQTVAKQVVFHHGDKVSFHKTPKPISSPPTAESEKDGYRELKSLVLSKKSKILSMLIGGN